MSKNTIKQAGRELESTGLEKILFTINDVLVKSLDYYEEEFSDPDICEELITCINICNKLIKYNYFEKSDKFANKLFDSENGLNKYMKTWERLDSKDWRAKKKDLIKLFKKLVKIAEVL